MTQPKHPTAKPTVVDPGQWGHWSTARYGEVTVVKVPEPAAFLDTAYLVYADGVPVGYVGSRKERGHGVGWDYAKSLDERFVCGMMNRKQAIGALLREHGTALKDKP